MAGNYADDRVYDFMSGVGGPYHDGSVVSCDVEKSWVNPWGLFGVGGNVWEMCASDSAGSSFGAWRGASWAYGEGIVLGCECRFEFDYFYFSYGFRLVLVGAAAAPVSAMPVQEGGTDLNPVELSGKAGEKDNALRVLPAHIEYRKPGTRNTHDAVQALNRGRLYLEQENLDQAIYYFRRSLEYDDTVAATFYYLACAHRLKGEPDLAKDGYLRALQLDPKLVTARYNLALVHQQQQDDASALRLLQEVVRDKPDYGDAHYVLGYLYAKTPATVAQARTAGLDDSRSAGQRLAGVRHPKRRRFATGAVRTPCIARKRMGAHGLFHC